MQEKADRIAESLSHLTHEERFITRKIDEQTARYFFGCLVYASMRALAVPVLAYR